jgi:dihydroflavonol-4-reductase
VYQLAVWPAPVTVTVRLAWFKLARRRLKPVSGTSPPPPPGPPSATRTEGLVLGERRIQRYPTIADSMAELVLDLVLGAVQGATRAINAALDADVERVILTSARATVQCAPAPRDHVFTAADLTPLDRRGLNAYTVSKVQAERAAWDIADRRGVRERLAVINPGAVIGPLLSNDPGTSVTAIQRIIAGALPMIPDLRLPSVNVQDIAEARIAAMTSETASGNRTIVATDPFSLIDVAAVLRERLPEASGKMPTRAMPTWLTWVASVFEPQLRDNRWLIGSTQRFEHEPAEALLGHPLRSIPDTIEETGRSLAERGLI